MIVYFLAAIIIGSSGVVYLKFGSSEVQEWNYPVKQAIPVASVSESGRHSQSSASIEPKV